MKLQLFRYYFVPAQMSLLNQGSESKRNLIRKLFATNQDFYSGNTEFAYFQNKEIGDDIILAQIGKKALIQHDLREEESFVRKREEEWPFRNLIINTNDRVQMLAFEIYRENQFSTPQYVLEGLEKVLNSELLNYGWRVIFEPIFDTDAFWSVIKENQGQIKKVALTLYVPNLFGTDDALSDELEGAKKNYDAQEIETEIINRDGNLKVPENEFTKSAIEHIRKGGGKYRIVLKNNKSHNSQSERKFINFDEVILEGDDIEGLERILKNLIS